MNAVTLQDLLERLSSVVADSALVATEIGGDWGRQLTEVAARMYDVETELLRYVREFQEAAEQ